MQALLADCDNIKVKRLFLFFADRHQHAWLKRLDRKAIDLGSGKRVLAKGGSYDAKYMITVPGDLMAFTENYRRQVDLLLRTVPFIAKEKCFALKGGTAINLFVRDLPRLSVDIDLTYVPVSPRPKTLGAIDKAMKRIEGRIAKGIKAPDQAIARKRSTLHLAGFPDPDSM